MFLRRRDVLAADCKFGIKMQLNSREANPPPTDSKNKNMPRTTGTWADLSRQQALAMAEADWRSAWVKIFPTLIMFHGFWLGILPLNDVPFYLVYYVDQAICVSWACRRPETYIRYRWALTANSRLYSLLLKPIRKVRRWRSGAPAIYPKMVMVAR